MKLLKTKYYPVDVDGKIIHLEAFARERDLADKWSRQQEGKPICIGLRGAHLLTVPLYKTFKRQPTITYAKVLADWKEEANQKSCGLWQGVAQCIVQTLEANTPENALVEFRKELRECRKMAISAYFGRVIRELKEVLAQQQLVG